MKLAHGATLALASWYLMVPPPSGLSGVDAQAPLTQWTIIGANFSSDQECEQAKQLMRDNPRNTSNLNEQHLLALQDSKCVPTENLPPASEPGQSPAPAH
jgi:hypothetical protein